MQRLHLEFYSHWKPHSNHVIRLIRYDCHGGQADDAYYDLNHMDDYEIEAAFGHCLEYIRGMAYRHKGGSFCLTLNLFMVLSFL